MRSIFHFIRIVFEWQYKIMLELIQGVSLSPSEISLRGSCVFRGAGHKK